MATTGRVKPSLGCGYLVAAILFLFGAGLAAAGVSKYRDVGERWTGEVVALAVLGGAFLAGGGAYVIYARRSVREHEAEERRRQQFPREPWKWRKEWLGPAIASKDAAGVGLHWFLAVMVCGISAPAAYGILTKPDVPKPAYLALIFPVIGVWLLWQAVYKTIQWRKFGRTSFLPTSLPGAIGGYLGGVIQVPARVALEKDARLTLRCVRRVTTGSGKNRRTTETTVWEREERIPAEKWQTGPGGTDIPVLFHIPAGQPATDLEVPDNQVVWRLAAQAAVPGVDFETTFEVPVFETGETAPAPEPGAPLLESYRAQVLDSTELARAGIRRGAGTWIFDTTHLLGTKLFSGTFAVGLTVLLVSFWRGGAHPIAWIVTGLFALIAWVMAVDVWFGRCELRIEGGDVVVREARLRGTRERRVAWADVADVRTEKSMGVGTQQYYRLVLAGRGVGRGTAARADEPFRARKIRFQLEQLGRELGTNDPQKMGPRGADLLRQLAEAPAFEIPIARHVPGPALAEAVKAMVLAEVRGGQL